MELHFRAAREMAVARVAVRELRKEFTPGRAVWLDRRQSAAEAAAAKAAHRLSDALRDVEAEKTAPSPIAKDMATRSVWVAQTRVAFVSTGEVHWTAAGCRRYSEQERSLASALATAV